MPEDKKGFSKLVSDLYSQSGSDYTPTDDDIKSISDQYKGDYKSFMSDFYKETGVEHELTDNDFSSISKQYGLNGISADKRGEPGLVKEQIGVAKKSLKRAWRGSIGSIYSAIESVADKLSKKGTGGIYFDEDGKPVAPWDENYAPKDTTPEFGKKIKEWAADVPEPQPGIVGFVFELIPQVTMFAAAIMSRNPALATAAAATVGAISLGSGTEAYDRHMEEKGEQPNAGDRMGVGVAYALAEYIPERFALGKLMPKGVTSKVMKKFLGENIENTARVGKEIIEEFAKKQPGKAKKLLVAGLKAPSIEAAQEIATEIGQIAADEYMIGKDVSAKEIGQRIVMAGAGGAAMGGMLAPFSSFSQRNVDKSRRKKQGFVSIVQDEAGKTWELIRDDKGNTVGISPSGKTNKDLGEDIWNDAVTLSTDSFNNLTEEARKAGNISDEMFREEEHNTIGARIQKNLDVFGNTDGNLHVWEDQADVNEDTGEAKEWFVISQDDTGMAIMMDREGKKRVKAVDDLEGSKEVYTYDQLLEDAAAKFDEANPIEDIKAPEGPDTVSIDGKEYTITGTSPEGLWTVVEIDENGTPVGEVQQLTEEEQLAIQEELTADPESKPDVRIVNVGKTPYKLTPTEDGNYQVDGVTSEMEANKAAKDILSVLGDKLDAVVLKEDSGDAFTVDTYSVKVTEKAKVEAEAEQAPAKISVQKINGKEIQVQENEDGTDTVIATEEMPFEKALPILEKKFKDHPKFEVVTETEQVEIPAESKYDEPVFVDEIRSIKIAPRTGTIKEVTDEKITEADNILAKEKEKVPEIKKEVTEIEPTKKIEEVKSSQKEKPTPESDLQKKKSDEKPIEQVTKPEVPVSEGKDVAKEVKGEGISEGLEEDVVSEEEQLKQAEKEVDTKPSEEQKKAGNYKMGHTSIQGFDITIENPKGSTRSGTDDSGKKWSQKMNNTYGYFKRTKAPDGDQIDVFLGENLESDKVFVVDQVNKDGSFDEFKVMMGFDNIEQAEKAYLSNYEKGWQGLGNITESSIDKFKKWAESGTKKQKPFAEYSEVKKEVEPVTPKKEKVEPKKEAKKEVKPEVEVRKVGDKVSFYYIDGSYNTGEIVSIFKNGKIKVKGEDGKNYTIEKDAIRPKDEIRFKSKPFYSPTEKALTKITQEKGTAGQFEKMLLKNGAKQAELDWMGFKEKFPSVNQKVTKQDIQNWIDENKIEVEEITKEDYSPELQELADKLEARNNNRPFDEWNEADQELWMKERDKPRETKYSSYQLPGGENYKEMVLTMPARKSSQAELESMSQEQFDKTYSELNDAQKNNVDAYVKESKGQGVTDQFKSAHFDEANILAHIRFNERTDSEGNKVLFIEELQSDWAQKGRKEGFRGKEIILDKITPLEHSYYVEFSDGSTSSVGKGTVGFDATDQEVRNYFKNIIEEKNKAARGVPQMPFKKTDQWINLGLRRMVRYAAENGFDKVAWTTGEQQAERYDLSKQVDEILWVENDTPNNGELTVVDKNGNVIVKKTMSFDEAENYIGKDASKKLKENKLSDNSSFIKVTKPKSIGEFSNNIFGRKMTALMPLNHVDGGVLTTANHNQVRGSIISFLPVDVVNILKGKHLSPNDLFNNKDMVSNTLSVDESRTVSIGIVSAIRKTGALLRTKLSSLSETRREVFLFPTLKASDLNPREIVSIIGGSTTFHLDPSFLTPEKTTSATSITESLSSEQRRILSRQFSSTELASFLNAHNQLIKGDERSLKQKYNNNLEYQLKGGELSISSPGMKAFYDKMVPKMAGKIGRKFGAKVETIQIKSEGDMVDILSLPITKEMYETAIGEGFPMFKSDKDLSGFELIQQVGQRTKDNHESTKKIAEEYSKKLNTPIKVVQTTNQLPQVARRVAKKSDFGAYVNGEVYLISGTIGANKKLAQETILHEIVGHKGLRGLLGNNFNETLDLVYNGMSEADQKQYLEDYGSERVAADEYLADMAEMDKKPSLWNKVISKLREMLRKMFPGLSMRNSDVVTLLGKSKKRLEKGDVNVTPNNVIRAKTDPSFDQTKTPEFKNWFGDSKVVDEKGEPLVVYHGTSEDFTEFEKSKHGTLGSGIYFTPNPELAYLFAKVRTGKEENLSVIPTYLSLQNPLTITPSSNFHKKYNPTGHLSGDEIMENVKKDGYDGIILKDLVDAEIVVFEPTQIKSATANTGAFDPANPDIRFKSQQAKQGKKQVTSVPQRIREMLQDNKLALKNWQNDMISEGIKIRDFENAYQKENLYHGKVLTKMDRFTEKEAKQLISAVSKFAKAAGLTVKETQNYLVAKHGPERNRYFWELNDKNIGKDFSGLGELQKQVVAKEKDPVDAMLMESMPVNEFGEYYTQLVERKAGQNNTDILWKAVNKATGYTLKEWKDSGFLNKEQYDELKSRYGNYVPLRGWEQTDEFDYSNSVGQYSSPIKRAKGRTSLSDDPLSYIMNMANTAVVSGERNRIKQAMGNLVRNNREKISSYVQFKPTYFVRTDDLDVEGNFIIYETIDRPEQVLFDEGRVSTQIPTDYKQRKPSSQAKEYEVEFYENGQKLVLVFEGSDPAVARAVDGKEANLHIDMLNKSIAKFIGPATRFISSVLTSRNPSFILPNMMRDIPLAIISEFVHGNTKDAGTLFNNMRLAEGAIRRDLRGKPDKNNPVDIKYQQFLENGGATGFVHLRDVDAFKNQIKRDIKAINNEMNAAVLMNKGFRKGIEYIEQLSEWSENISRFAVYLNHIDKGESPEQSAIAAKNSTVNFNKKGRLSPTLNGLFAFFNAAIQASDKYFKMWGTNWKKMAGVHSVLMVQGFMSSLLLDLLGDEDEEGMRQYDKVSDYVKSNYLVLPIPYSDRIVTIPMPHVLRAFHGIGVKAYDIMTNRKKPAEAIIEMISGLPSDIMPIDGSGFLNRQGDVSIKPFTPTVLKPLIELEMNENFMGMPITPEPFTAAQGDMIADTNRARRNVNSAAKKFTDNLYELGGGDETGYRYVYKDGELKQIPSMLDLSPHSIEHLFSSYLGGTGSFFNNLYKTTENVLKAGDKMLEGEEFKEAIKEVDLNSVPVMRRFIRQAWGDPLKSAFYDAKRDYDRKITIMRDQYNNVADPDRLKKFIEMQKEIGISVGQYKIYEGRIDKLNDKHQQLLSVGQEDAAKEVDKTRRELMQKIINLDKK